MAIGTPSSVREKRIFFKATIVSVARSRARYTVPYAPTILKKMVLQDITNKLATFVKLIFLALILEQKWQLCIGYSYHSQ